MQILRFFAPGPAALLLYLKTDTLSKTHLSPDMLPKTVQTVPNLQI